MMKKWLCILLCALLVLGSGCAVLPARSEADPAATQTGAITNVIFMIGDGMGRNHLRLAEQEGYTLFMEQNADLSGWSRTRSYSHSVTDSAAGATALSCGVRITNRQLCIYPEELQKTGLRPRIITENAKEHGMRVGIVTTDKTRGATPAAYSVHTDSRDNNADISAQQLASGFDLIWGANTSTVSVASAAEHGFIYISNLTELRALVPGERSFGQFAEDCWSLTPSEGTPTLAQMTEKSISLLSADAPDGFFLMVEGAHIDKFADDKKDDGTVDYPEKRAGAAETVASFDNAVKTAVEFARGDGHTLVIVTADHETGKLSMDETTGEYTFHSASHTDTNVPIFVYGAPDLFNAGDEIDNCDIPNLIAERLGWEERFPIDDPIDKTPSEEPSGSEDNGENNPSDNSGKRTLWQRIKDWFLRFFDMIAGWFRR